MKQSKLAVHTGAEEARERGRLREAGRWLDDALRLHVAGRSC